MPETIVLGLRVKFTVREITGPAGGGDGGGGGDDDVLPVLQFATAASSGSSQDDIEVTVVLDKPPTEQITVPLQFTGTLTRHQDYDWILPDGSVLNGDFFRLPADFGLTSYELVLRVYGPTNDAGTVVLTLLESYGGATLAGCTLGARTTHTVNVTEVGGGGDVYVQFQAASRSVDEGDVANPPATIVTRLLLSEPISGGTNVVVRFQRNDSTAQKGVDFEFTGDADDDDQVTYTFSSTANGRDFYVKLLGNQDPDQGDRTAVFEIVSATNGVLIGTLATFTLTIVEDDFVVIDPVITMLATAKTVLAESNTETGIQIPVELSGVQLPHAGYEVDVTRLPYTGSGYPGATEGADYVMTSPATGTLVFAPNQTVAYIRIKALQDSTVEGIEEARIGLANPTNGATLGTPSSTILQVQDDDTLGEPADAEVEFLLDKGIAQGAKIQVSACWGIPPTAREFLPAVWNKATGEACEVFPVAYTEGSRVDWIQVVGPAFHTTDLDVDGIEYGYETWTTEPPANPLPSPFAAWSVDMTGFAMRIETHAGVVFTATLSGTPVETRLNGATMREERHFARFLGPAGEKGPGLTIWLRFLGDKPCAEMAVLIHNNLWRPTNQYLYQPDPDVTGEVWFDEINFLTVPGFLVACDGDAPHQDTAALKFVKDAGKPQLIPNGQSIMEHYILYNGGGMTSAEAQAKGRMMMSGGAIGGGLAAHMEPGWGPESQTLPDHAHAQRSYPQNNPTYFGRRAFLAYRRTVHSQMDSDRKNGTGNSGYEFSSPAYGYWHAWGVRAMGAGSGERVFFSYTGDLTNYGFRECRMGATYGVQRAPTSIVNPDTGDEVTMEDLVAASGDGKCPWVFTFRAQGIAEMSSWCPHWYRPSQKDDPNKLYYITKARYIGQDGYSWNQEPADPLFPLFKLQRCLEEPLAGDDNYGGTWQAPEGDHSGRHWHPMHCLAWGQNYGWAMHLIRIEGLHMQRACQRFAMSSNPPSGFNNVFFIDSVNYPRVAQRMVGREEWGGYDNMTRQRGHAMALKAVVAMLRLMDPDDPRRANCEAWVLAWSRDAALVCTRYGVGETFDHNNGGHKHYDDCQPGGSTQNYPNAWVLHGETNNPDGGWANCQNY